MIDCDTGLSEEIINGITAIFESHDKVSSVKLFGSRAMGNYKNGSDVDIAIFGRELTYNDVINLSIALDDLNTAYKFDLILFDTIQTQSLKEHINRVGINLY